MVTKTDYDEVSASYDGRYARRAYAGSENALRTFAGSTPVRILELGCGTAHWIALLRSSGHDATGIDPSRGMLSKAIAKVSASHLALARAEQLPWSAASFDRVFSMNAVHHFTDARRAFHEARRVLRPGGTALTIALDPSAGLDEWSLYDYFPGTRERDLERYPRTAELRAWMAEAGFEDCETATAEHIEMRMSARDALSSGHLSRSATSQLSELSEAAYRAGIEAIERAARDSEQRGEVLMLTSSLTLFATTGRASARP